LAKNKDPAEVGNQPENKGGRLAAAFFISTFFPSAKSSHLILIPILYLSAY
jgi:hypothetical protein